MMLVRTMVVAASHNLRALALSDRWEPALRDQDKKLLLGLGHVLTHSIQNSSISTYCVSSVTRSATGSRTLNRDTYR